MTNQLRCIVWFVVPFGHRTDTMAAVLLGAIGCSMNQTKVLQPWSRRSDISYPILTICSDYRMNESDASREALILRRTTQHDYAAGFPVLARICLTP